MAWTEGCVSLIYMSLLSIFSFHISIDVIMSLVMSYGIMKIDFYCQHLSSSFQNYEALKCVFHFIHVFRFHFPLFLWNNFSLDLIFKLSKMVTRKPHLTMCLSSFLVCSIIYTSHPIYLFIIFIIFYSSIWSINDLWSINMLSILFIIISFYSLIIIYHYDYIPYINLIMQSAIWSAYWMSNESMIDVIHKLI